jgi:hypothetical protein
MACPDAPVELMLAAAASSAAHPAEGSPPITSTSVARSSVSSRVRSRATCRAAVRACSGSAVQAGSSKTFFGQAGRNARAASILRIQCGTAVSGCLGKARIRASAASKTGHIGLSPSLFPSVTAVEVLLAVAEGGHEAARRTPTCCDPRRRHRRG